MIKRNGKIAEARLKEVLQAEKKITPFGFIEVLRLDILYVIESYIDVDRGAFKVEIESQADGTYRFACEGSAAGVKPFRMIK